MQEKTPAWGEVGTLEPKEAAILYTYELSPDGLRGVWKKAPVQIAMYNKAFSWGAMRAAFHTELWLPNQTTPLQYVTKKYRAFNIDEKMYHTDVIMQTYGQFWAKEFNKRSPPRKVTFVDAHLVWLTNRPGKVVFSMEPYMPGSYQKYSNNAGGVYPTKIKSIRGLKNEQEKEEPETEEVVVERNTPQAFSHFTYEASGGKLIIVDIQGVGDIYTDPQIHTSYNKGWGKGNLGSDGIEAFLWTHQCSAICAHLHLRPHNPKSLDKGTKPAPIPINAKEWLSKRHVNPESDTWTLTSIVLKPADVGEFEEILKEYRQRITSLSLASCNLNDFDIAGIIEVLGTDCTVEHLDLRKNNISNFGAKVLADFLSEDPPLKVLTLSANSIGEEGALAFQSAMAGNNHLQELHLDDNQIPTDAENALSDIMDEKGVVFII